MFEYSTSEMLSSTQQRILRMQSEICKILSNPKRLEILQALREGEMTVGQLAAASGLRQANVSQHLALMRHRKIVIEKRTGNTVSYRIVDNRINKACDIMRAVLLDQASEDSKLVQLASTSGRS